MAEQRMRELEREGGAPWLAERLRRGDLERWRIEVAAYCGDRQALSLVTWCPAWCPRPKHRGIGTADCPRRLHHHGDGRCALRVPLLFDFDRWLRGLERWPGALREAELACDVLEFGHEVSGAARATRAEWCLRVARVKGEQRVREAIAADLIEWALR